MSELIERHFSRMDGPAPFTDALYFTPEAWAALSASALATMENERFQAWLTAITAPPAEPELETGLEPEVPE